MRGALGLLALCACASRAPAAPAAPAQWPAVDVPAREAPRAASEVAPPAATEGELLRGARAVEVNEHGACAVLDDRRVWCWEGGEQVWAPAGPVRVEQARGVGVGAVPGARDAASICLAPSTFCALRVDGAVWCRAWIPDETEAAGADVYSTVVESTLPDLAASALRAEPEGCVAVRADGARRRIIAPTRPDSPWSDAAAPPGAPECALPSGTPRCVGSNAAALLANDLTPSFAPAAPSRLFDLRDVRDVAFGDRHGCAAMRDGAVRCWGRNLHAQLGTGRPQSRALPTPVPGIDDARAVRAARNLTCAVRASGEVWCWGSADPTLFGEPGVTTRATPAPVPGLTEVVDLRLSNSRACALRRDGTVWCWGSGMHRTAPHALPPHQPAPVRRPP